MGRDRGRVGRDGRHAKRAERAQHARRRVGCCLDQLILRKGAGRRSGARVVETDQVGSTGPAFKSFVFKRCTDLG